MGLLDHRGEENAQSPERTAFLQSVVDEARVLTGGQSSALCLLDSSASRVTVVAASGAIDAQAGDEATARHGISGSMLASGSAVSCQWCDTPCCPFSPSARHQHLVVPIRSGVHVRGLMCATSTAMAGLGRSRESTLTYLATMAGSALAEGPVNELAKELGALAARQRMAADMHDGIAQSLVRLHMQLESALSDLAAGREFAPALLTMRDTLTKTIDDFRTAIDSLRNPRDSTGQEDALSAVLTGAVREARIPGTVISLNPAQDCFLPHAVAEEVRRVVLEALSNANRHGHAETVRIGLRREDGQVLVTVTDDGCGLDLGGNNSPRGQHFGLDVMRLRAASIGGHLEIRSVPGRGTEVALQWPDIS
jgi:signal transduction histidine kinase